MTIYGRCINRLRNIRRIFSAYKNRLIFKLNDIHYGAYFHGFGRFFIYNAGTVDIGDDVTINSAVWANPIGGTSQTLFQIRGGVLKIGDRVGISNTAITCKKKIIIGDDTLIGAGTSIYDTDFHPLDAKYRYGKHLNNECAKSNDVLIGNGCFIGAHCIILKGVCIGDNAVIGAGSVVTKNVPANEVWAGNPARFVKKLT